MKTFAEKKPILASIITAVVFIIMLQLIGIAVGLTIPYDGSYLQSMIAELVSAIMAVIIALIFGRISCLGRDKKNFFRSFVPCAYFLGTFAFTLLITVFDNLNTPINSAYQILTFVVTMLLIGVTEEIVFRGVIASMIFDKYGKDRAGVWFSVLISGVIFGLGHLGNAFSGIEFSGVLVQTVLAMAVGMVYSAIYYRTGNLWTMIVLHALNDFVALFSSGFFAGADTMADTIASYNVTMYTALAGYTGLLFLLLRPGKLCSDIFGGDRLLPSSESSAERMFKAIAFICAGIICCIIYGVIAMFT